MRNPFFRKRALCYTHAIKRGDGMDTIFVWTKQHQSVYEELERTGRYTAKQEYIRMDLEEHADLVLSAYDWLVAHGPDAANRPEDAEYPVWVSFEKEAAMRKSDGTVLLELCIDPGRITPINIAKWGMILNYSYIPCDEEDKKRHLRLLKDYGVSDVKAYLSQFYPEIKREIVASWERLFDQRISVGSDAAYGTIWEIQREWITNVIR